MTLSSVVLLGTGGSAGLPQIGGPDGAGDWGQCDPAEPRNRRSRASIVLQAADGRRLLVDTAPELRLQLTANRIPRIDAILYTHPHADHIAGLDEVRILNRLLGAPMPGYATRACWADLRQRFDYAFRPWNGGFFFRPVFEPQIDIEPGDTLDILGLRVGIFEQDHGFGPTLGLRVGPFGYSTDVVRLSDAAFEMLAGIDTWVVDCFTRGPTHPTHANLDTVLGWAERLRPRRTILTHLGPDMDYTSLSASLPPGIELGFDGLAIDFG
jgi:phosphoribosyl 1,2-cyclic phosphate phosphodiesterase